MNFFKCIFHFPSKEVAVLSEKFTLKAILRGMCIANCNAAHGKSISCQIILLCLPVRTLYFMCAIL